MEPMIAEESVTCDLLVIGGGAAGAFASIKAREAGCENVLLIEKARVGSSGASCFAAGMLMAPIPGEDDLDFWMKEYVEQGQYLNDQEWLQIYLEEAFARVQDIECWGLQLRKTSDGKYERIRGRGGHPGKGLRSMVFAGQAGTLTEALRKKVNASGVRIIDWTMITDLLTEDGTVIGAVGFHTRTGAFRIFRSKATVLATGSGKFRCATNIGHRMNNYEATAMAFRAGAELMNCDFTTHQPFCGEFKLGGMNMTVGLGGRFVNARDEQFMEAYDPVYKENAAHYMMGNAPLLEVRGGRGPLHMDLTHLSPEAVRLFASVLPLNAMILEKGAVLVGNKITRKLEWSIHGPSLGRASASIKIGVQCQTTLPGLYAAGDAATKMPSGTSDSAGALPFAFVSGARAGKFAADYIRHVGRTEADEAQVRELKEDVVGPLQRKDGVEGDYLIEAIQDIVIPYEVLMLRHGERMEKALTEIIGMKEDLLPLLYAHDPHFLRIAHEARSFVLVAEIALRAGLVRKESRYNIREDYPYLDNVDWLKWVHLKRGDRGMKIWLENIPMDRYPVKPKREKIVHPCLEAAKKRGILKSVNDGGVQWA
jgi:succinate dehydrogenase / fumarate reductase flavoprotein subunit